MPPPSTHLVSLSGTYAHAHAVRTILLYVIHSDDDTYLDLRLSPPLPLPALRLARTQTFSIMHRPRDTRSRSPSSLFPLLLFYPTRVQFPGSSLLLSHPRLRPFRFRLPIPPLSPPRRCCRLLCFCRCARTAPVVDTLVLSLFTCSPGTHLQKESHRLGPDVGWEPSSSRSANPKSRLGPPDA